MVVLVVPGDKILHKLRIRMNYAIHNELFTKHEQEGISYTDIGIHLH